jgi:hypothetical protein
MLCLELTIATDGSPCSWWTTNTVAPEIFRTPSPAFSGEQIHQTCARTPDNSAKRAYLEVVGYARPHDVFDYKLLMDNSS